MTDLLTDYQITILRLGYLTWPDKRRNENPYKSLVLQPRELGKGEQN